MFGLPSTVCFGTAGPIRPAATRLYDGPIVMIEGVPAMTTTTPFDDVALERAVSRLNLEPSVTSARWGIIEDPPIALAAEG